MTVDLKAKIEEFVKANRKVWPEWPKEVKPRRRNPRHRHRDQVYLVMGYTVNDIHTLTDTLLLDNEVLEIDGISYMDDINEETLEECWYAHYHLANKPGEGVRLREVTAKEARRLWQGRLCNDRKSKDDDY